MTQEARETVLVRQRSAAITECEALITRLKQQHAAQLAEANGHSAADQNARMQEQDAARAQLGSAQATMRTLSSERDLAVAALERRDALHAQEREQMLGRLQQSRELTDEAEAEAEVACVPRPHLSICLPFSSGSPGDAHWQGEAAV